MGGLVTARLPRRRVSVRVIAVLGALAILLGGGWLWVRDSQLVAVQHVTVTGASGPDAAQIRSALRDAARTMTTLDVHLDRLRSAVQPYSVVKDLRVTTQFPHAMRIRVIEQVPVGAVEVGGHAVAVAGDGTLLHDVVPSPSLPTVPVKALPGGSRLVDPQTLGAVAVLGAAPARWLARITTVTTVSPHGLVAQLRGGPSIYFGDSNLLRAKWSALAAVLADPGSQGAAYIDVSDPARPAAGVGTSSQALAALAAQFGSGGGSQGASTTPSNTPTNTVPPGG